MACKVSCPYWKGHECLILKSKPTLSEFRNWLVENVGEEVESAETLLRIYTHFTFSCLRCPSNPHRKRSSRMTAAVDEGLRHLQQARQDLVAESKSR